MKLSVKFSIVTMMMTLLFSLQSCGVKSSKEADAKSTIVKSDKVEVYYFHLNRRCITCQTVESVAQNSVKELYGDKVPFFVYNIEEEAGKEKAKELGISGQTLAVVGGETKINLTSDGFMNARNNPEKFKQTLKENIDKLLN